MSKKRARPARGQSLPPGAGGAPAPRENAPVQQQPPLQANQPVKKRRKPPAQLLSRSERQRRQVRRSFRRKWTRRILFFLLTCGLAFLAVTVFFQIRSVQITGTAHYSAEELAKSLGVEEGDNLFTFRASSLERALLAQYPYLSEVSVTRQLPDTLVVTATDAVPAVALSLQSGGYYLMDAHGKLLEQVAAIPEGVASVTGVSLRAGQPGQQLTVEDADRAGILIDLTEELTRQGMMGDVDFINVSALYDVRFSYQERLDVRLGEAVQLTDKLRMLGRIVQDELSPSDMNTVYLSDPATVYCPPTTQEQIQQSAQPLEDSIPPDIGADGGTSSPS